MARKIAAEAQEVRDLAADEASQERAAAQPRKAARCAATYLHHTHPVTGLPVVFVPGEALPEWVPNAD